jgi:small subunit ribosomal protein S18
VVDEQRSNQGGPGGDDRGGDGGERPRRRFGGGGGGGRSFSRRKVCGFCVDGIKHVDYKDVPRMRRFISERGMIEPRRKTGTCAKHQRSLTTAIKRARHLALLSFTEGMREPRDRGPRGDRDRGPRFRDRGERSFGGGGGDRGGFGGGDRGGDRGFGGGGGDRDRGFNRDAGPRDDAPRQAPPATEPAE